MAEHYDVNGLVDFLLPTLQSNPFRCQCLRHLTIQLDTKLSSSLTGLRLLVSFLLVK